MASRSNQVRLFLGLELSMTTSRALIEVAESMRRVAYEGGYQIRWVQPTSYHVTLKFLGWCQPEIITAIRDRVAPAMATVQRFEFTTAGVGAFPKANSASVIWAGIDDHYGHLAKLAEKLEDLTSDLGFPREKRPFHPHVTLGRVKRRDDVTPVLARGSERNFSETLAKRVVLFESVMKPEGSEYTRQVEMLLARDKKREKRQTGSVKPSHAHPPDGTGPEASLGAPDDTPGGTQSDQPVTMESTPQLAVQGSDTGRDGPDAPAGGDPAGPTGQPPSGTSQE